MVLADYLAQYLITGTFTIGIPAAFILARKRIGVLNAASWLVVFGALIVVGEHTSFAIQGAMNLRFGSHSQYHIVMAAVYTAVAGILLSLIARMLLRNGSRVGWYSVLLALSIGGGIDLLMVVLLFPHGIEPFSEATGIALYSYHFAWVSALAISYRHIFGKTSLPLTKIRT